MSRNARDDQPLGVYLSHLFWLWCFGFCAVLNGRLYTRRRVIRLDKRGQTFVVRLVIRRYSIKAGARGIIRLDKLSSVVRRSSCTAAEYSSRGMCLVPFLLETYNQTNNECLPKLVQTDNASSSIKTAIQNSTKTKTKHKSKADHKT